MSEPNSKLFRDDPATYYAELGAQAERQRIIKLLAPWAKCDPDMCGENGEAHHRDDCDSFSYAHAIALINPDPNCHMHNGRFDGGCSCQKYNETVVLLPEGNSNDEV